VRPGGKKGGGEKSRRRRSSACPAVCLSSLSESIKSRVPWGESLVLASPPKEKRQRVWRTELLFQNALRWTEAAGKEDVGILGWPLFPLCNWRFYCETPKRAALEDATYLYLKL